MSDQMKSILVAEIRSGTELPGAAEGYIGLRGAMTRAAACDAADEAARVKRDARLSHETRTMLADAQYRAKLINGDERFDALDMADLDTLLGIANGMTQRRRVQEADRS